MRLVRARLGALCLLAVAALAIAPPATAQPGTPPPPPQARSQSLTARYHVRQMENVLERAVQHAADLMRRRLQAVTPDLLALAGAPRAQGFRIDGYGLFFSVEVPRLSESVNWALRMLSQDSDERVLASLQKVAAAEQDPVVRADLERAIRTVQMQLATMPRPAGMAPGGQVQRRGGAAQASVSSAVAAPVASSSSGAAPQASSAERGAPTGTADMSASVAPAPLAPAPPAPVSPPTSTPAPAVPPAATMSAAPTVAPAEEAAPPVPMGDPSVAYEDEVKNALVDAMLDYAGSLPLPAVEWVTVAARDAGYVAFPDAVSDMVTVTLSVRVSDLIDFRAQRLTREEARTRVVIREF